MQSATQNVSGLKRKRVESDTICDQLFKRCKMAISITKPLHLYKYITIDIENDTKIIVTEIDKNFDMSLLDELDDDFDYLTL